VNLKTLKQLPLLYALYFQVLIFELRSREDSAYQKSVEIEKRLIVSRSNWN